MKSGGGGCLVASSSNQTRPEFFLRAVSTAQISLSKVAGKREQWIVEATPFNGWRETARAKVGYGIDVVNRHAFRRLRINLTRENSTP